MAALTCEICGGKLIGRPGGIFECDSCGIEYDSAWAKAKIQEIKGTVQVEDTVEVQGIVKVDGPVKVEGAANVESLLKRGEMALEDKEWDNAVEFFDQVLNIDAECAEAFLGKAMAAAQTKDRYAYDEAYTRPGSELDKDKNITRIRKFGDEGLRTWLDGLDEKKRKTVEKRKAELWSIRERLAPVQKLIGTGSSHTVGLKADGTVVAVGRNWSGQCDVGGWSDIVAVAARASCTVGLKADGTVVAVGNNWTGQCDVGGWSDIVAVAAASSYTVGLKADGTVVAVGKNELGWCDVSGWSDIVAVAVGDSHTVGLKADGTMVAVGYYKFGRFDVSGWSDIVAVAARDSCTVGLKADGTVVAVGANEYGQCDVGGWKLFNNIDAVEQEQEEVRRRIVEERAKQRAALENERDTLQTELANLKGLFTGKRRWEIESRLSEINKDLYEIGVALKSQP